MPIAVDVVDWAAADLIAVVAAAAAVEKIAVVIFAVREWTVVLLHNSSSYSYIIIECFAQF